MKTVENKHKESCLVFSVFLILLHYLTKINIDLLLYIALFISLSGLFLDVVAKYIHIVWFSIGKYLGKVVSFITLPLVYFVILCPIAFLYRIFNNKKSSFDFNKKSSFKDRNYIFQKEDLRKIW